MDFVIEKVETKEQLDMLYSHSAFTLEGLAEDSVDDLIEWLNDHTVFTKDVPTVYITKGKVMNKEYSLHGSNSYQDDLSIISVVDINSMQVALARFSIGGRWFDDIVDNNRRREEENGYGEEY